MRGQNTTIYSHTNVSASTRTLRQVSLWLAIIAGACLWLADIQINSPNPWAELSLMGQSLLRPNFWSTREIFHSVASTLAFALQGIALAAACGFALALAYRWRLVRAFCAFIRAIHELFWALIFIQLFGLTALTGLLAIAIPYAGTLAKIYGELFEETDPKPKHSLHQRHGLSAFFYTTLPLAWQPLSAYTHYRLECAIRSSVVLGFVGLPTLGFHLETALRQGQYNDAAALLYCLLALVASLRLWCRRSLLPLYLLAAVLYLPPQGQVQWELIARFFSEDVVPAPLRHGQQPLLPWLQNLWQQQLFPGLKNTLILSQIALAGSALLALLGLPLNSPLFLSFWPRRLGDGLLIIGRTLPEYLLAFIGLLWLGPSMLPAILALSLHNGTIIAHLLGRYSEDMSLRADASRGLNRYTYEVLPRLYRPFLALLLYRWEVILRETAILGILGITTLGFYIDSAFEEFRFDRALLLILAAAVLNMTVDSIARWLRRRLHLKTTPETI